jgi:hypothetical protein
VGVFVNSGLSDGYEFGTVLVIEIERNSRIEKP